MSNWSHQHGAGIKDGSQQVNVKLLKLTWALLYIKYVPNWGLFLNVWESLNRLLSACAACSLTLYLPYLLPSSKQETMQDLYSFFFLLALSFGNPELLITVSSYVLTLTLLLFIYIVCILNEGLTNESVTFPTNIGWQPLIWKLIRKLLSCLDNFWVNIVLNLLQLRWQAFLCSFLKCYQLKSLTIYHCTCIDVVCVG